MRLYNTCILCNVSSFTRRLSRNCKNANCSWDRKNVFILLTNQQCELVWFCKGNNSPQSGSTPSSRHHRHFQQKLRWGASSSLLQAYQHLSYPQVFSPEGGFSLSSHITPSHPLEDSEKTRGKEVGPSPSIPCRRYAVRIPPSLWTRYNMCNDSYVSQHPPSPW